MHHCYALVTVYNDLHPEIAGFQDLISPQGAGQQLSAVLSSHDPVVRMRALALVIGLGGQSEAAVKALQHSGL